MLKEAHLQERGLEDDLLHLGGNSVPTSFQTVLGKGTGVAVSRVPPAQPLLPSEGSAAAPGSGLWATAPQRHLMALLALEKRGCSLAQLPVLIPTALSSHFLPDRTEQDRFTASCSALLPRPLHPRPWSSSLA